MAKLYVIEARDEAGKLDLSGLQPEHVFGRRAITGISEDEIARVIFNRHEDAVLDGRFVPSWPKIVDARFAAREKTWS